MCYDIEFESAALTIAAIVIVMVVIIPGIVTYFYYQEENELTITVKEKWIKRSDDSGDRYMVSDTNGNVYEITDLFFAWRWNSSDLYAYIDEGETYHIRTYGWRVPLFSWYPNIVEAHKVYNGTEGD